MKVLGFILIIIGFIMLILRGFQYTKEEKIVDVGPLEINKKEHKMITWPYYAGAVAIIAGTVLLLASPKKSK